MEAQTHEPIEETPAPKKSTRPYFIGAGLIVLLGVTAFIAMRYFTQRDAFGGGLLQPSSQGRVYLLNLQTGGNLVLPFQPRLAAAETLWFSRPALIGETRNEFVVADNRKRLYRRAESNFNKFNRIRKQVIFPEKRMGSKISV